MTIETIQVNQPRRGIGDALLGLAAVCGLKAQNPSRTIIYSCDARAAQWVALFQGYDALAPGPLPGFATIDLGPALTYDRVVRDRRPWATRYAHWCGAPDARRPWARPLPSSPYQGYIALCPLTAGWPRREWSLDHWLALERSLLARGHRVVVLGHDPARLTPFASHSYVGAPRDVAAVIADASLVVGVDTGLMHLAGALGTPAIVIAGPTLGGEIYGNWPSVRVLEGDALPCHGCFGIDIPPACQNYCAALNATAPARVLEAIATLLDRDAPESRVFLEAGQRRDRDTGEIEPWFTEPALDQIRQWRLSDKIVLEWGGGYSSLWWARRCRAVVTIEANAAWSEMISALAVRHGLDNLRVLTRAFPDGWSEYPALPDGVRPDIVVIDGARRLACLESAISLPRPFTLIIDNWRQRSGFHSPAAERLLRGFPGVSHVDTDMLEDTLPWQTGIWRIA